MAILLLLLLYRVRAEPVPETTGTVTIFYTSLDRNIVLLLSASLNS